MRVIRLVHEPELSAVQLLLDRLLTSETISRRARRPSIRRGPGRPIHASGTQKILPLTTAGSDRHDSRRVTMSGRTLCGRTPHHDSMIASGAAAITSSSVTGGLLQSRCVQGLVPPARSIIPETHELRPGTITGFGHHSTRIFGRSAPSFAHPA